jgi:hypothetical protein
MDVEGGQPCEAASRAASESEGPARAESLEEAICRKIDRAVVEAWPFPHVIVDGLLPGDVYDAVIDAIPPSSEMTVVDYPGTGFGRAGENYRDYGYAFGGFRDTGGPLGQLHEAFASSRFERTLLGKFSRPLPNGEVPIPVEKHAFFAHGARNCTTVFDLQVDLPGYAIPPHNDVPAKIVTFQLHLARDSTLADYGTLLCVPKEGWEPRRRVLARAFGRAARAVPAGVKCELRRRLGPVLRRFDRSSIGVSLSAGAWMSWEDFEVVKVAPARPNSFLAFAPNVRSFHAVNFDVPADAPVQERKVVRGFVMAGRDAKNIIRAREA